MPIYIYETSKGRRFELKQGMSDPTLTHDPATGEPVQRVISGGYGFIQKGKVQIGKPQAPAGGHSCGGGCGCGGH